MSEMAILQERIGHVFRDEGLLRTALTHRSYHTGHNERLEFLGDAVLGSVMALLLYRQYEALDEGTLSRLRASLVRKETLCDVAQGIALSRFLRVGEGEARSGGASRPSILADALEAVLGAVFLDAGFSDVVEVVRRLFHARLSAIDLRTFGKDAKTQLQEYLQGQRMGLPEYQVLATHGAAHEQEFEVECFVPDLALRASGSGSSRRFGEQVAAGRILEQIARGAPPTERARGEGLPDGAGGAANAKRRVRQ